MNIEGIIKTIGETETFGNNGFRKREVVIETQGQYPQPIMVEFVQDKVDLLDAYAEGQIVSISFNLRGREWVNPQGETKYFNSIQGWKIEGNSTSETHVPDKPSAPESNSSNMEEENDDLPF